MNPIDYKKNAHFACHLLLSQIFQLLLPELGTGDGIENGAFILLLILTVMAPLLSWASFLVAKGTPALAKDRR